MLALRLSRDLIKDLDLATQQIEPNKLLSHTKAHLCFPQCREGSDIGLLSIVIYRIHPYAYYNAEDLSVCPL